MCLHDKNNSRFEKCLDEIGECFGILDRCSYKGFFYYKGLSEFWYLKGLYTNDELLIEKSRQMYESLRKTTTKSKNAVMVNNPYKRFGKEIIDFFK